MLISSSALEELRQRRRCLRSGAKVLRMEDAAAYINERGFVPLWPLTSYPLPSLSEADGNPKPRGWSERAWDWKEQLPGDKLCAYSKFFGGRGTFFSWGAFPYFWALYGRSGDYEEQYADGLLDRLELRILRHLSESGETDSRRLWREVKGLAEGKRTRFTAALTRLQEGFWITVSGGSLEGWSLHYWDLLDRHVPEDALAYRPTKETAHDRLTLIYLENAVLGDARQVARLFRWNVKVAEESLARLERSGEVTSDVRCEGAAGRSKCYMLVTAVQEVRGLSSDRGDGGVRGDRGRWAPAKEA